MNRHPLISENQQLGSFATRLVQVTHHHAGIQEAIAERESVAVESPLEIRINGTPFSVTMSSPGHDAELAHGLLLVEGMLTRKNWYSSRSEQRTCKLASRIIDLCVPINELGVKKNERRLMATSSCGLCGVASLDGLDAHLEQPLSPTAIRAELVPHWFATMRSQQAAFDCAGGTHAAAAFTPSGECLIVHEDIGRHNAVDKVIGTLLARKQLRTAAVLAVSGRVSFEIMVKALRAGISTLAAVSAPSSLAIDLARRNHMTLLAFCRDRRFTVYSGANNIILQDGYDVRIVA